MNKRDLNRLIRVLDRQLELPALETLIVSLDNNYGHKAERGNSVIAFDTNVLLRLVNHPSSVDIIDSLCKDDNTNPIILPGQVVQEFWNNHGNVVQSIYKNINNNFDSFKKSISKYNNSVYPEIENINLTLDEFGKNNKHVLDPASMTKIKNFFEQIKNRVQVPFAPRNIFWKLAESRKKTKTPPGFKDEDNGDYFVWVDLLWGLMKLRKEGNTTFSHVIFLSHDAKIDWCKGDVAHPILVSEMKCLVAAQFEIWSLDQFVKLN